MCHSAPMNYLFTVNLLPKSVRNIFNLTMNQNQKNCSWKLMLLNMISAWFRPIHSGFSVLVRFFSFFAGIPYCDPCCKINGECVDYKNGTTFCSQCAPGTFSKWVRILISITLMVLCKSGISNVLNGWTAALHWGIILLYPQGDV